MPKIFQYQCQLTFFEVVVHQFFVSSNILRRPQISGEENLGFLLDLNVVSAADPGVEYAVIELTSIRGTSVARFIKCHKGRHLTPSSCTDESSGLGPDTDDGANGPVVIDNGGSVEGVSAYGELSLLFLVGIANFRILLRGALPNDRGSFAGVPHELRK